MWFARKKPTLPSANPAPPPPPPPPLVNQDDEERRAEAAGKASLAEVLDVLDELVERHGSVLVTKRRQKSYRDDYGRLIDEAWQSEIEYLRLNIVDDELMERCGPTKLAQATVQALVDTPVEVREALDESVEFYLTNLIRTYIEVAVKELDADIPASEVDDGELSPAQYEHLCADVLRSAGWTVRICGGTGDQGVDLIADRDGLRAVIQCKLYSNAVGNGAVQEVYTGRVFHSAHLAAVVSPAGFTRSARAAAEQTGVFLLHHAQLSEFSQKGHLPQPSPTPPEE